MKVIKNNKILFPEKEFGYTFLLPKFSFCFAFRVMVNKEIEFIIEEAEKNPLKSLFANDSFGRKYKMQFFGSLSTLPHRKLVFGGSDRLITVK